MRWLVIGIGNTLRRDDGLGHWLAERVARWRLPGVTIRPVHQLTPELAAEIATHDCVLFLDACREGNESRLIEIGQVVGGDSLGHAMSPEALLALVNNLGARPSAWLMAVPGREFDFGEDLTATATAAGDLALAEIGQLLREDAPCTKSA